MSLSKPKREGAATELGRRDKKQKGVLMKMKLDSLTSYLGPKYKRIIQEWIMEIFTKNVQIYYI